MKKKYKIQLPKGKKVTMTNVDFENGVMTVNVELEKDDSKIWDKMIQEYGDAICGKTEQKYEPKDGDFVKIQKEGNLYFTPDLGIGYSEHEPYIGIFKSIEMNKGKELLLCYIILMRDSQYEILMPLEHEGRTFSVGELSNLKVSPATEEEKKLLINKLAEKGKRWNEETRTIENVRWRAKEDELFYVVAFNARVDSIKDSHNWFTDLCYETGNYFKTREAAEKVAEQIRNILKSSKEE